MKRVSGKKPAAPSKDRVWSFNFYVAGMTPRNLLSYQSLKEICSEHLHRSCRIRIIDVLKTPVAARRDQIVALPTLVRKSPLPNITIIGDLTNTDKVLATFYGLK